MNKYFSLIIFIFFISCSKEEEKDKNGIIVSKKEIWLSSLTDDDSLSDNFMFRFSVYSDNLIVTRARKSKQNTLKGLSINDGSVKWIWNDFFEEPIGASFPTKYQNSVIWQEDYNNYCVDLITGKTIWKNASEKHFEYRSFGVNNIFTVSHLVNRNKPTEIGGNIVVMDSKTGKPIFIFKPKYDTTGTHSYDNCGWGYMGFPLPFTRNGNDYILIKFNDPPSSCNVFGAEWLGLYNYTKKEWVYERQKLRNVDGTFGMASPPTISNDKIYSNPSNAIVCHDLMTGQKLWETGGTDSNFRGVLVENGNVYINGNNGNMTCLNASGGTVKWVVRTSGSSTTLSYLNGVVYFVGGGDGKLHAVDAETGEYLWKIESPDKVKNKWAVFSGMCAVVPGVGSEKGKIVVTSGLNAYCYEAIR
jgi:outer membrane protein assembly factor BamB